MRNPLKRLARRDPDRLTLKQRAAALRATAAKVMRRKPPRPGACDPAHAAIEAHRTAFAEWDRLDIEMGRCLDTDPRHATLLPAYNEALRREEETWDALLSTRATTTEGLRGLLGYLPSAAREACPSKADSGQQRALDAIGDSFLGLENSRRLIGEPRTVTKLPRAGDILANGIMTEWMRYAALNGPNAGDDEETDAAADRAIDRRFAVIAAAERLPVNKSALVAKALALAWVEYVEHWRQGKPREAYEIDGRLAFDIHAILSGSMADDTLQGPGRLPDATLVMAGFDVGVLSTRNLRALHDAAEMMSEVATAITCQPKSYDERAGMPEYNAVGRFADWIAGVCDVVTSNARSEARGRPADGTDAGERLAILARSTVSDDDFDGMLAFARDTQAYARRGARG